MSKETELSNAQIDNCVGNLGMAENSILVGPGEIRKAMRAVIAADRELRQGDAIDASPERDEKPAADTPMPPVAWAETEYEEHFGCDSIQAYRSEKPGWEALVSQSDAQAALAAKDAEIDALKADYLRACQTVAAMHEAATGRAGEAPWLGVIEDVAELKAERDALKVAAEGECKPSLYLFLSENGGIRYWTREADAAARKAIEFGTGPERFYATPVPASAKNIPLLQHNKE